MLEMIWHSVPIPQSSRMTPVPWIRLHFIITKRAESSSTNLLAVEWVQSSCNSATCNRCTPVYDIPPLCPCNHLCLVHSPGTDQATMRVINYETSESLWIPEDQIVHTCRHWAVQLRGQAADVAELEMILARNVHCEHLEAPTWRLLFHHLWQSLRYRQTSR